MVGIFSKEVGPVFDASKADPIVKDLWHNFQMLHHVETDDHWYSCPKSGHCSNDGAADQCNCGADGFNEALAHFCGRLQSQIMEWKEQVSIDKRWDSVTKNGEEYRDFSKVANKRNQRPDLHAFMLLGELFPSRSNLIRSASHDEIHLDIDDEKIELLTNEQILELSLCGVHYDANAGGLCMFF